MLTTLKEWFFRRKFKKRVFKKKLVIADDEDDKEDPPSILNAFSYSYGDRIAQSTEQKKEKAEHSQRIDFSRTFYVTRPTFAQWSEEANGESPAFNLSTKRPEKKGAASADLD